MRKLLLVSFAVFFVLKSYSQDSTFVRTTKWLSDKGFSIRKTFDGSKAENKPAGIAFLENHKSPADFFSLDIAIKLSEWNPLKKTTWNSELRIYPKVEWHKSDDASALKNKLDGGVNLEFMPAREWSLLPFIQGNSSFKRNLIDKVFETKLGIQATAVGSKVGHPGFSIRDPQNNFRLRYYPYIGLEYYKLPDLITDGITETISNYFVRFFAEIYIVPQVLCLNLDATYRQIINNQTAVRTWLPLFTPGLYLYPGRQESIGVGYEYMHGYDPDSKFQAVQLSTVKLSIKI